MARSSDRTLSLSFQENNTNGITIGHYEINRNISLDLLNISSNDEKLRNKRDEDIIQPVVRSSSASKSRTGPG